MLACRPVFVVLASLALGSSACVEAGTYSKAASQLADARQDAVQRAAEIRSLQWQLTVLGQQFVTAEQRFETVQRELRTQVQQLSATNAALADRLKQSDDERAALVRATSDENSTSAGRERRGGDLHRCPGVAEARDPAILERLGRIEHLVSQRSEPFAIAPGADEVSLPRGTSATSDTVDPWGGSRR
jgi:hypothetical protein